MRKGKHELAAGYDCNGWVELQASDWVRPATADAIRRAANYSARWALRRSRDLRRIPPLAGPAQGLGHSHAARTHPLRADVMAAMTHVPEQPQKWREEPPLRTVTDTVQKGDRLNRRHMSPLFRVTPTAQLIPAQPPTRARMDKDAMEGALRATVNILYWEAGAARHECIQLACATFPYFALAECAPYVQIILGVHGERDKLIETFDPAHAKWVTHEAWMPRDLSACPYVLYRDRSRWGLADDIPGDMDVEVSALLERVKHTRKRLRSPRSSEALPDPGPRKRQKASVPRIEASNETPPIQTRDAPEAQHQVSLAAAPSSAHARWPLKYVVAMAAGFHTMASAPGTRRDQFEAAFGLPFPPTATYHDNVKVWNAAHQELKEKYMRAGYSDAGLWKHFRREVMARCAEGKVLGRRRTTLGGGGKQDVAEV
ncbi:hypothetical protein BJ912DRAFT_1062875 [Pholiota molesta]|nr:hypothetical protein BJ912DRAFT_1062875 [Pholiota molesta]